MKPKISVSTFLAFACVLISAPVMAEQTGVQSDGSQKMHQYMLDAAEKSKQMKMTGNVDSDFATMMADHHRTGIKMAKEYLQSGEDQELKQLAKKMIEAQSKELKTLESHS